MSQSRIVDSDRIREYLDHAPDIRRDDEIVREIEIEKMIESEIKDYAINAIPEDRCIFVPSENGNFFFGLGGGEAPISRWWVFTSDFEFTRKYSVKHYVDNIVEYIRAHGSDHRINFIGTDFDGENLCVNYECEFDLDSTIEQCIDLISEIEGEIFGSVDLALHKDISPYYLDDEIKFCLHVLLPLFRRMSYDEVMFNHGPREFGKDIILTKTDELRIKRIIGVQVKEGNLSGEANSDLDTIIGQIDDAINIPFIHKYKKEEIMLDEIIIIISGRYVGNAPDKIRHKAKKSKVHFFDIDWVNSMIERYK